MKQVEFKKDSSKNKDMDSKKRFDENLIHMQVHQLAAANRVTPAGT